MDCEHGIAATAWGERNEDAGDEGSEHKGRDKQLNPHLLLSHKHFFRPVSVDFISPALALGSSFRQCCHCVQFAERG